MNPIYIGAGAGVFVLIIIIMFIIAKMKGKIGIVLNKYSFAPGETIEGTLHLKLKKPLEAKSLRIGLIARLKQKNYSSRGTSYRNSNVYEFFQPVAGQGIYSNQSTNFKLGIPNDIASKNLVNSTLNNIMNTAQVLTGKFSSIKYYVVAELDIAGFNISKKVQISII